jgi:hypothetical protein
LGRAPKVTNIPKEVDDAIRNAIHQMSAGADDDDKARNLAMDFRFNIPRNQIEVIGSLVKTCAAKLEAVEQKVCKHFIAAVIDSDDTESNVGRVEKVKSAIQVIGDHPPSRYLSNMLYALKRYGHLSFANVWVQLAKGRQRAKWAETIWGSTRGGAILKVLDFFPLGVQERIKENIMPQVYSEERQVPPFPNLDFQAFPQVASQLPFPGLWGTFQTGVHGGEP